ncbi:hypothetical protein EYV94_27030 [Puteibacter caeruleilacunae]|nr:hypothetical protein EYV94_27030 [Puteibacter caeruleilacunae]
MKKSDLLFLVFITLLFAPFFMSDVVYDFYSSFNKNHPYVMGFIKFAILATTGEAIGLRLREGNYNKNGFGLIPRAIVWGFLGITIVVAFQIFASGAPVFMKILGVEGATEVMRGPITLQRVMVAFGISVTMNLIYAPVMMTLHKITDTHIVNNGGTVSGLLKPIEFGEIMKGLDWGVQWNFVFKKTIPFFWIPMHTITFLLPVEFRVLFAALLGIALGIILSIAVLKSKK